MHIKYAEYFLGIGAPGKAIQRVATRHGDTCEFVYGFEIDKYARNAFSAIHGVDEDKIYHDVTDQPKELPYVDIVFYSPPCQSFSIAGKKEGTTVDKGNLFYAALQGIIKSNPKYAIMENVSNLKNQFADDYNAMLRALDDEGYTSYAKVLNSKDYGIPQNRERIFIVSMRKDVYEDGQRFEFPLPIRLDKKLKDLLEDEVDEKYYLTEKQIHNISHWKSYQNPLDNILEGDSISPTLTARGAGEMHSGMIVLKVNSANNVGYEELSPGDALRLDNPKSKTGRGRVGKECSMTLTTSINVGYYNGSRIRTLTPLECFSLQGFDDIDYYKAIESFNKTFKRKSDSQMYKRAGNSITVNVEEEMLENLIYQRKQLGNQLSMF